MSKEAFRVRLLSHAEHLVLNYKRRIRQKQLDYINFKLHGFEQKYKEKNEFFEI